MERRLDESLAILRRRAGGEAFDCAVVLGSGLGGLADRVAEPTAIDYDEFPCFPVPTVAGHWGRLIAGHLEGRRVLVFQGRHHLYEGYDARQVTVGIRLAAGAGCRRLLLTNAAGGINSNYRPGDIMFLSDHINLTGDNPLRGIGGNPFIDLSRLYRQELFPPLLQYAQAQDIRLHRGVLAALAGPSYETPAEVRMLGRLGADVVSMSTVPEAIMGKFLGMEVAGLSLVANYAAGIGEAPLNHGDVLEIGRQSQAPFSSLVRRLLAIWPLAAPQEEETG